MTTALWLMGAQGLLGAFDTVYYHEHRARLPAGGARTRGELWLHGLRDFIYAILFCSLPFVAWKGGFAVVLFMLIIAEIAITMADFVVEVKAREPEGVEAGERVTHALMAIIYGAFLAHLVPEAVDWFHSPTGLSAVSNGAPAPLAWALALMGAGVFTSGLRDVYAALGLRGSAYPWG